VPHSSEEFALRLLSWLALLVIPAVLLLGGPSWVEAVAQDRFTIAGNADVSRKVLIEAIEQVACDGLDSACVDAVCRALAETYWEMGYLSAEVRCERLGAGGDTVGVTISEGPASLLRAIKTEGVSPEDQAALDGLFGPRRGSPFSQGAIEDGIRQALNYYDTRGYPLAKIVPEIEIVGGDSVEVVLSVEKGPRARLGDVHLRGLKKTRRAAAIRETGLRPGELYDGRRIEAARAKLGRLGIFEEVSEPVLGFDVRDTTVSVTFDVAEATTGMFEGLLAYAPAAGGSKIIGSFDLQMLNLGGTLRKARTTWARRGDDRLAWSLHYREPRLLGKPFALETTLASDVIDTSFARRKLWLGLAFTGEGGVETGAGGSIGATKDRTAAGGEGSFTERGLSFYIRREGRARPLNPKAGSFLEVSHEVESLNYTDGAKPRRTLSSLKVDAQYILGLGQNTNLALGARFQGVFTGSGRVPPSHQVRLGGMTSIRGYAEEWFTAKEAAVATIEARWLPGPLSRVYGFLDAATLENATYDFGDVSSLPLGYGVGLMAETSAGIIRLEIALADGDTWSDAKLHLGLVERF